MLKIATIILGLLSVGHFCLEIGPNGEVLGKEEEQQYELPPQLGVEFDQSDSRHKTLLVTVDAAFCIDMGNYLSLHLVIGNKIQVFRKGKFFSEHFITLYHLPEDMHVQAAFVTAESAHKTIFYGDKYGQFSTESGIGERRLNYGPARAFFRKGGPDAAGRKGGKTYVFKGCFMAVRKSWNDWGKPVDVRGLGLPCDINAAWKEREEMVILKGDRIWRWKADDTVDGPEPFDSSYTLKEGYALMPVIE